MAFGKGDVVRVLSESDGWGTEVKAGDLGKIMSGDARNGYYVDFRNHRGWFGQAECFELVTKCEPKKIERDEHAEETIMPIKNVFEKITDVMNREIPSERLESVLLAGLKRKEKLNALLGHDASNDYRTILPIPVTEEDWIDGSYENSTLRRAVLRAFACDSVSCSTNTITINGQSQRLTRVITKDLNKYRFAHPFREFLQANYPTWTEAQYGAKLGEKFVNNANKVAIISTNAFDFLSSSGQHWGLASFSSCHNWRGCHFSGNFSYINDEMTALCYIAPKDNLDYKEGRSWVYLPSGFDCIVQPKSYGTFTDVQRKLCREHLEKLINKHHSWDDAGWKGRTVEGYYTTDCSDTAAYFDSGRVRFVYPTNHRPDYKDKTAELYFREAKCPQCGTEHTNAENGVCHDCNGTASRGYECENCGGDFDEQDGRFDDDGNFYCDDCYHDNFVSCEHCGNELWREDDSTYRVGDHYYCSRHYNLLFFCCDDCGEDTEKDEMVVYNGEELCECCAEGRDLMKCEDCGTWHEKDDLEEIVDTGEWVCQTCKDSWYPCKECGEVNSEWHDADNELCRKCATGVDRSVEETPTTPSDTYVTPTALAA